MKKNNDKRAIGLFGIKMGMTSMFDEQGNMLPVTVIKAREMVALAHKTYKSDNGKTTTFALLVGLDPCLENDINKPLAGQCKKYGFGYFKNIQEILLPNDKCLQEITLGSSINLSHDMCCVYKDSVIDAIGISIGKGFAGVMKRHHFKGGRASHGNSVSHRTPGSTGHGRSFPGKVFRGQRMAGHMGAERVTVQGLHVAYTDIGNNIFAVHGCVPGKMSGKIYTKKSTRLG